jgi:hypothetical protein
LDIYSKKEKTELRKMNSVAMLGIFFLIGIIFYITDKEKTKEVEKAERRGFIKGLEDDEGICRCKECGNELNPSEDISETGWCNECENLSLEGDRYVDEWLAKKKREESGE